MLCYEELDEFVEEIFVLSVLIKDLVTLSKTR